MAQHATPPQFCASNTCQKGASQWSLVRLARATEGQDDRGRDWQFTECQEYPEHLGELGSPLEARVPRTQWVS